MPLHDWSGIPAGLFHDFHQTWSIQIKLALNGWQVPVPLESTYQATWNSSPEEFRVAIETGVMPVPDAE